MPGPYGDETFRPSVKRFRVIFRWLAGTEVVTKGQVRVRSNYEPVNYYFPDSTPVTWLGDQCKGSWYHEGKKIWAKITVRKIGHIARHITIRPRDFVCES